MIVRAVAMRRIARFYIAFVFRANHEDGGEDFPGEDQRGIVSIATTSSPAITSSSSSLTV